MSLETPVNKQTVASVGLVAGKGQYHSLLKTDFAYDTITFADIWSLAENPSQVAKDQSPWVIVSSYNGPNARSMEAQMKNGKFWALWVDVDEGDPPLVVVVEMLRKVLGPCAFLVYSTRSSGEVRDDGSVKVKWRAIIPTSNPMQGLGYQAFSQALNDALATEGLTPDRVSERVNQLCYLPNRGPIYEVHKENGNPIDFSFHPLKEAANLHFEELKLKREDHLARAAELPRIGKPESSRSYLAAFKRRHNTETLLEHYGFTSRDGTLWRHPDQKTDGYGTELFPDGRIHTFSSTVGTFGLKPTGNGKWFGDGFDLFVHFSCHGDRLAAEVYAKECLADEDTYFIDHGKRVWAGLKSVGGVDLSILLKEKKTTSLNSFNSKLSVFSSTSVTFNEIGELEWNNSRLAPKCIVENYLFADLGILIAPGGVGKTTLVLYEAIHIVLGLPLYGREIITPGPVAFLTAEDSRELLVARLRKISQELGLTPDEIKKIKESILICYVGGEDFRFCRIENDMVVLSQEVENVVSALDGKSPALFVVDPAVSFGVGEQRTNDAEQGLIRACRHVRDRLNCCVRMVHHTGKANARAQTVDQYSGRGGSAMADGARMVHVLLNKAQDSWLSEVRTNLPETGQGLMISLPKMSYCVQQSDIYILREGYKFTLVERAHGEGFGVQLTDDEIATLRNAVLECWEPGRQRPRKDIQADNAWVGHLVAQAMGLDSGKGVKKSDCTEQQVAVRERVKLTVLPSLYSKNVLVVRVERDAKKARDTPYVTVSDQ